MRKLAAAIPAVCLWLAGPVHAQRGTGDWMTTANDGQRSSWVRTDGKISVESLRKPGFEMVWKVRMDNQSKGLNSITPPSLLDFYIGYRGFRTLGFFGGSSDNVIAIDTDIARLEWQKKYTGGAAGSSVACPGGLTSAVTRPTTLGYPPMPFGRGMGRGTPAKSSVGEPHEGATILKTLAARNVNMPPPPPMAKKGAAGAPAPNPFSPRIQYALALTSDGKLHQLWVSNGEEPKPGVQFVPPGANAMGLVSFEGSAYVSTTNSCGSAGNGVWGLDLASGSVSHFKTTKEVAGNAGPAVGPDGTLYVAAGSELISLEPKKLEPKAIFKTSGPEFTSSPVVFPFKGKDLIVASTNDGRLQLLDAAALNKDKALATTGAFSSPGYAAGSITSWQDAAGVRWVLAAAGGDAPAKAGFQNKNGPVTNGAVVAWKVVEKDGGYAFEPGWVSRDLTSPLPPMVVNGVVFALSSGEYRAGDASMSAAERAKRSGKAVLYALDGLTGETLWNSGSTLDSFVHSGGLAAGGSRVYVATYSGTQYAFGFPTEH